MTDVSRESLAAALERELNQPHPAGPKMYAELADAILADAILASLPSPAPEPPPRDTFLDRSREAEYRLGSWVHRLADFGTFTAEQTKEWDRLVADFKREVRAAQPAPDLDVDLLARAMEWLAPNRRLIIQTARVLPERGGRGIVVAAGTYGELAKDIAAEYARLLQARESGGEP